MKLGFGKEDITPDLKTPTPNAAGVDRELKFILDHIWTRALVFKDKNNIVVLVAADVPGFLEKDREDLIQEVEKVCAIKKFELVFHSVHQHQAPNVSWNSYGMVNKDGGYAVNEEYYRTFLNKTALAVKQALKNLEDFSIEYGEAEIKGIESNRRIITPEGKIIMRYSRPPKELRKLPEGHIDPLVRVFYLKRKDEKSVVWVNYHGHPTATGGDGALFVSADFPGEALRILEKEKPENEYIYMTGPNGNLNPGKYITGDSKKIEDRRNDRDRMGKILAEGVKRALSDCVEIKTGPIKFKREKLLLQCKKDDSPEQLWTFYSSYDKAVERYREALKEMKETHQKGEKLISGGKIRFAHRIMYYYRIMENGKIPVYFSVMNIGDLNTVFYPGEMFLEASDIIREKFPGKRMLTISLCDGLSNYVVTEDCYEPDKGGYEYSASLLAKGSFTRIVNKAIQMLKES